MKNGWIKLHRKILDNPIAKKPNYAWLWVTLLLKANHEPQEFIWNGGLKTIKAGQLLTGRKILSEDSGIPETTIEDILNFLENQQQIRQQKTNKNRIITILKWLDYQNTDIISDNKATTKRQPADTNNNVKNDKNIFKDGTKRTFKDGTMGIVRWGEWVDINTHAKLGNDYLKELK